jgi:hypothetical protein
MEGRTRARPFRAVDPGSHGLVMDPIRMHPMPSVRVRMSRWKYIQLYAIKVGISAAVNVMREFGGSHKLAGP